MVEARDDEAGAVAAVHEAVDAVEQSRREVSTDDACEAALPQRRQRRLGRGAKRGVAVDYEQMWRRQ